MSAGDVGTIGGGTVLVMADFAEVQPFDQGGVILNTETGQLYSCNHVTMACLRLIDGERTIDMVASAIAEEYSAPPDEVSKDLIEISTELANEKLVTIR